MPKNTRPANRRPGTPRRHGTATAHLGNRALLALAAPFTTWLAESTDAGQDGALAPADVLTVLAESMDWLLKRTRTTQVGPQTATRWNPDDLELLLTELDSPVLAAFARQQEWDEDDLVDAVAEAWQLFLLFLEDTDRWSGPREELEECLAVLDDSTAADVALAAAETVDDEEEDAALAAVPLTARIGAVLDDPAITGDAPDDLLATMQELELLDEELQPGPAAQAWRSGDAQELRELRRDALTVWVLEQLGGDGPGEEEDDAVPALLVAVLTSALAGDPVEPGALAELLPEDEEHAFDASVAVPAATALLERLTAARVLDLDGGYTAPRGLWPALANVVVALAGDDHDHDDEDGHEGHDHG